MRSPHPLMPRRRRGLRFTIASAAVLLLGAVALPAEENEIAAVASKVSNDYVRAKQADGSFQVETYTFGPGGHWSGTAADPSIDKLTLLDIGHIVAVPLATQNYLPAQDPKATKLLIMVYWGTTRPPEHSSSSPGMQQLQQASSMVAAAVATARTKNLDAKAEAGNQAAKDDAQSAYDSALQLVRVENAVRDRENVQNVKILGYDSWWNDTDLAMGAKRLRRQELIEELEDKRYFVVLMAYDFQMMWKEKKTKLLWETRFSIRSRGNEFDKQLAAMAQQAANLFGQDSHGLLHKPLPKVRVDLGETKVIGTEPAK